MVNEKTPQTFVLQSFFWKEAKYIPVPNNESNKSESYKNFLQPKKKKYVSFTSNSGLPPQSKNKRTPA